VGNTLITYSKVTGLPVHTTQISKDTLDCEQYGPFVYKVGNLKP